MSQTADACRFWTQEILCCLGVAPTRIALCHSIEQHRRAELEAQMRSREEAKKKERADRLQEDLRVHREAAKYDPWGRAGGGAPQSPHGSPRSAPQQAWL